MDKTRGGSKGNFTVNRYDQMMYNESQKNLGLVAEEIGRMQCRNCWDWQDGKCLFWGVVRSPNKDVCREFEKFDKIGHAKMGAKSKWYCPKCNEWLLSEQIREVYSIGARDVLVCKLCNTPVLNANKHKGDSVEMLNVQKNMSNDCGEEYWIGGSGASGSDTRLKNKSEYDEILERLDTVVDANTRRVANLRGAVARVLGEPERDKDLCEDITMSQTLNRLAEQLDANNKMLDKILEKTRRAVGSLKLFTD